MPYVITEPCIGVKDKSCQTVCPVDCIYEGEDMLYINPDECIDCGLCEPECPVNAIFGDSEVPPVWSDYIETNAVEGRRLSERPASSLTDYGETMNNQLLDRPVGQLVAEKPARSRVFERWGIDYCCGGKKTLFETCEIRAIDSNDIVRDLENSDSDSASETAALDLRAVPLGQLCDHIVKTHHGYLREALPRLSMLIEKVADRHGSNDRRLIDLKNLFARFRADMTSHMAKEEHILFPMIEALENDTSDRGIEYPIRAMLAEHDNAGADVAEMRSLTNGFSPTPEACNTYRAMLHGLAELETDLHQHVHKENNILFPRAIEKEASLA